MYMQILFKMRSVKAGVICVGHIHTEPAAMAEAQNRVPSLWTGVSGKVLSLGCVSTGVECSPNGHFERAFMHFFRSMCNRENVKIKFLVLK